MPGKIKPDHDLLTDGFVILPSVIDALGCAAAVEDFRDFVKRNGAYARQFQTEAGLHSRLANLHMQSCILRNIAFSSEIITVCDAFFGKSAAICSSLYFEQGSEQVVHRDTPFFHTNPADQFLGVWCALEDVKIDAGPVFYYPKAHLVPENLAELKEENPSIAGANLYSPYIDELIRSLEKSDCRKQLLTVRKGDVLIWHPRLPHGGSPIKTLGLSRHSVVFHMVPEFCEVFGPDVFFDDGAESAFDMRYVSAGSQRLMLDHGRPIFLSNV
jgi:phytanoyl-CoA hydroxylase